MHPRSGSWRFRWRDSPTGSDDGDARLVGLEVAAETIEATPCAHHDDRAAGGLGLVVRNEQFCNNDGTLGA